MIWYRHWLEMRFGLRVLVGLWIVFGFTVSGPFRSMGWTSWRTWPWEPFQMEVADLPLAGIAGTGIFVWAEFAGRMLPFIFAATLALAGTGLDGLMTPSGAGASPAYALTLPVSRTRLVCTRLAAALGIGAGTGILLAAVSSAVLLARGASVPIGAVVESVALGILALASALAVTGALVATVRSGWAFVGLAALFVVCTVPISALVASPARLETPWGLVAACLIVTGLALAYTVFRTSSREY